MGHGRSLLNRRDLDGAAAVIAGLAVGTPVLGEDAELAVAGGHTGCRRARSASGLGAADRSLRPQQA